MNDAPQMENHIHTNFLGFGNCIQVLNPTIFKCVSISISFILLIPFNFLTNENHCIDEILSKARKQSTLRRHFIVSDLQPWIT